MEIVKRDVDEINELVEKITGKNPKAITTTQALNELVKGLTGEKLKATTTSQALNYIEQNYNGGSSIDPKTLDIAICTPDSDDDNWIDGLKNLNGDIFDTYLGVLNNFTSGKLGIFGPNYEIEGIVSDIEENGFVYTIGSDIYDIHKDTDADTGDTILNIEKR